MSDEMDMIFKEAVVACFKVLSGNSPEGTQENLEKPR
jgi:hypothetical protein